MGVPIRWKIRTSFTGHFFLMERSLSTNRPSRALRAAATSCSEPVIPIRFPGT
ncbi:hypothetical protein GOP47_0025607, partial [Adiantum capillus-veneris]